MPCVWGAALVPRRERAVTSSPSCSQARASQPPAKPDAPVMSALSGGRSWPGRGRSRRRLDRHGVFERTVPVAREVGLLLGWGGLRLHVHPPLELPQDEAEEQVSPRGLGKGGPIPLQLREVLARGVKAVGDHSEGPEGEVLDESRHRTSQRGGDRHGRGQVGVNGTEERSVAGVHGQTQRQPALAASHGFPEQLDVVVLTGEDALVQRLLQRPYPGRCGAAGGASQRAGAIKARTQEDQL
jgi:hypothetical protein